MRQRIINWLLKNVVRVVIPDDVIRSDKTKLFLGTKEITEQEVKQLQAEIKALETMRLWSILNESIKQVAYERGWKDSTTMEHLNAGKIQYNTLETQASIINIIKNYGLTKKNGV